jgi:hypothetical protein
MRFYVKEWNKDDKEYIMLILTEEDVENNSTKHRGAGFEILVLPSKYKDVDNPYLNSVRLMTTSRRGYVIYV